MGNDPGWAGARVGIGVLRCVMDSFTWRNRILNSCNRKSKPIHMITFSEDIDNTKCQFPVLLTLLVLYSRCSKSDRQIFRISRHTHFKANPTSALRVYPSTCMASLSPAIPNFRCVHHFKNSFYPNQNLICRSALLERDSRGRENRGH